MVYELERVLRVCNGFLCSMSVTYLYLNLFRQQGILDVHDGMKNVFGPVINKI